MVDGELTVWADGSKIVLHSGDAFDIPAGTPHVVAATGEGVAHTLTIASPSGFAGLIQEAGLPDEGGAPPEWTPADRSASCGLLQSSETRPSARPEPRRHYRRSPARQEPRKKRRGKDE